jgi:hypothetical protein
MAALGAAIGAANGQRPDTKMMRKRCGTCNSLRDCNCKGRERGVLIKAAPRLPEHQQVLSAEGRRAAAKREQQQQQQQQRGESCEFRQPVRPGQHWPVEVVHAQPPKMVLRKEEPNAASMRHLTAEGQRAALMRLPKGQRPGALHAQGPGARRSKGPVPVEHESVRLRQAEQQQKDSDAESNRAEQRARQERFALEQHQVSPLASCPDTGCYSP